MECKGYRNSQACLSNRKSTHSEVLKTALFSGWKHFRRSGLYLPSNKGCLLLFKCGKDCTIPSSLSDSLKSNSYRRKTLAENDHLNIHREPQ